MTAVPGPLRATVLVAAFGARQVAWTRRTVFMIFLCLVPAILAALIRANAPPGTIETVREAVFPSLHLFLVEILCIFYGASLVRDAIEDKTLGFLLTRPLGRRPVIFGLFAGMIGFVLPLSSLSAAGSFLATRAGLPGPLLPEGHVTEAFTRQILVVSGSTIFYSALFVTIGLAARFPTVLGLVFLFLVDGGIGSIPGVVRRLSPAAHFETLLSPWFRTRASIGGESDDYAIAPEVSAAWLAGLFVLLLVIMAWIAGRRDFSGPSRSASRDG